MITDITTGTVESTRVRLSTLWIFALLNYLYCDVMSLMDSSFLKQYMAGKVSGIDTTPVFFLAAAMLMEIPIAMILLSRVLNYRTNRWANVLAGTIMTAVQFSTLFFGSSPSIYYLFFSIIEIACTVLIVWFAWNWRNPERAARN